MMPSRSEHAIRRVGLDPADFIVDDVPHNPWLTAGIWHLTGPGRRPMILKHLTSRRDPSGSSADHHWSLGADEPQRWNYWAREGLAYPSGIVDIYSDAGIHAPKLQAVAHDDNEITLLLEFVDGRPAEGWTVGEYAVAATALGRAHAPFVTGRPYPDVPWLSSQLLRQYSTSKPVDWTLLDSDEAWSQALIQRNFPTELRRAARLLHASRDRLYAIAEALPRTLCHLDFWTKNLITRTDGAIALLDWGSLGDGAIGEDIGNLVPDAAFDHFILAESLPDLEQAVLTSYLEGLDTGGSTHDPHLAQLGMYASAVKYDWLTPFMLAAASTDHHHRYGGTEEIDADYLFQQRGLALLHNAHTARRALELADRLNF